MGITGHSCVASLTDVLILYLHRLAFFVQKASQVSMSWITYSDGLCYFVYVRPTIAGDLVNLRSVPAEL
jgi:hypothetical protein